MYRNLLIVLLSGLLVACWAGPLAAQSGVGSAGAAIEPVVVASEADVGDDSADTAIVETGSLLEAVVFYIVAAMVVLSALGCVLSVNIVRMAVFLFATLGSVAVLFFLMAANFLGAIQLIVYAGGTLIVIIFGVMLTSKSPWVRYVPRPLEIVAGAVVFCALFVGLAAVLARTSWSESAANPIGHQVADIGRVLLTTYLVPFELVSVLLLAVMVGAAYLARPDKKIE